MRNQSSRLTQRQRRTYDPVLQIFYGKDCFYCLEPIDNEREGFELEYDHLDNKEYHNQIENIVRCHAKCNDKKKNGDSLFNDLAKRQIQRNSKDTKLQDLLESRKKINQDLEEKNAEKENEEIRTNEDFTKIIQKYLDKEINTINLTLPFTSTLNDMTLKCYNKVGHASQNTVRRILDMLCAKSGKYQIVKDGGRRFITRRIDLT